jgi:nitrate reductase NapAB chaperone NapD
VEAGFPNGRWVPVMACASTDEESRQLHETVAALPGVLYVDVVAVHFEQEEDHCQTKFQCQI